MAPQTFFPTTIRVPTFITTIRSLSSALMGVTSRLPIQMEGEDMGCPYGAVDEKAEAYELGELCGVHARREGFGDWGLGSDVEVLGY
jgi:hypothetical protein